MKKWKIIEKKDISPSRWFPLEIQKVQMPNGCIIDDYYISPMDNVAMILPITKGNEIVLVRQYKHAIGKIMTELPAGFQEDGLSIKESALKELEEETGIKTTLKNLIFLGKIANNPTKSTQITFCYLAKNLEFNSKQKLDVTENIEIVKVTPSKALEMVRTGKIWVSDSVFSIIKTYLTYPEIFK